MNKQNFLFTIIGLLAGFIIGFFFANTVNRNAALQSPAAQNFPNVPFQNAPNNQQTQSAASIKDAPNGAMMPEVQQTLDAAKNDPNNFDAQIKAGQMYLRIQNTEKASEYFKRAVNAHHDNFQDLVILGNSFFDVGNYEEAEKWYTQALEKNPDDVDVRTDLGSTFMQRAPPDLDRAIKEYRTSLERNPKHESTIFNLSLALMRKGDLQGAQVQLNQLEKVNPSSPLIQQLKEKLAQPAAQ